MSLTHILIFVIVVLVFSSPSLLPRLGRSVGEGWRNLKKGSKGEGDIDVTDTVKRIPPED